MKNVMLIIFSFLMVTVFASCTKSLSPKLTAKSNWILTEWPNKVMPSNGQATLNIQDQKISGKAFCNNFFGSGVFNGNAVKFKGVGRTLMACESLNEAENMFLTDLEAVNASSVQGNKLILRKDNQILMVFTRSTEK